MLLIGNIYSSNDLNVSVYQCLSVSTVELPQQALGDFQRAHSIFQLECIVWKLLKEIYSFNEFAGTYFIKFS